MALILFDDRDGTIWLNGEMLPWRAAKTHTLSHGITPAWFSKASVFIPAPSSRGASTPSVSAPARSWISTFQ